MQTITKYCKTCALRGQFQNGQWGCSKFNIPVNLEKDFCSWHERETDVVPCDICRKGLKPEDTTICQVDDHNLILCNQCCSLIGKCATCTYQRECGFEKDHSMPHYVMQTIQQGMMTMQTQIKNPELVQKHCPSCRCHVNNQCLKQTNGDVCQSWSILPELLR